MAIYYWHGTADTSPVNVLNYSLSNSNKTTYPTYTPGWGDTVQAYTGTGGVINNPYMGLTGPEIDNVFVTLASWDINNLTINCRYSPIFFSGSSLYIYSGFTMLNSNYEIFTTSGFTNVYISNNGINLLRSVHKGTVFTGSYNCTFTNCNFDGKLYIEHGANVTFNTCTFRNIQFAGYDTEIFYKPGASPEAPYYLRLGGNGTYYYNPSGGGGGGE